MPQPQKSHVPLQCLAVGVLRAQLDFTPEVDFVANLRLRAGRQELMLGRGRLVSSREGPNLRRAF